MSSVDSRLVYTLTLTEGQPGGLEPQRGVESFQLGGLSRGEGAIRGPYKAAGGAEVFQSSAPERVGKLREERDVITFDDVHSAGSIATLASLPEFFRNARLERRERTVIRLHVVGLIHQI